MLDGKKSAAERIVYDALAIIGERTGRDPIEQLEASIKTLTPSLEVRSRRVGGATYQVPVEVPTRRARTLAIRWLVEFARQRREKTMAQRLANELLDRSQAGRRVQAQGRHLPHGAGQQGLRALPLVAHGVAARPALDAPPSSRDFVVLRGPVATARGRPRTSGGSSSARGLPFAALRSRWRRARAAVGPDRPSRGHEPSDASAWHGRDRPRHHRLRRAAAPPGSPHPSSTRASST